MKSHLMSVLKFPTVHFLILGIAAFGAYSYFKPPDREIIYVTPQTIDALVQQRESIVQNPTTPEEQRKLIEGYIEDEVLLREAYKRGFDKSDYRVRKRILSMMRTYLGEVIPEPSVAQLRAYYEASQDRYLTAPSRSFEHVYFSFASNQLPKEPEVFIRQLEKAADIDGLGEYTLMGNRYNQTSFQRMAANLGKPFAQVIFDLPLNQWRGPVKSFKGIHYVRVTGSHEPELPPFEKMESYLRTDYLLVKGRESQTRKIEELMKNYEIIVE